MILSKEIGKKLFDQIQRHRSRMYVKNKCYSLSSGPLTIKRMNPGLGTRGFDVYHSGQFRFTILKSKNEEYLFDGVFKGFYVTTLKIAEKITAFPTPSTIEYSPEMSQ